MWRLGDTMKKYLLCCLLLLPVSAGAKPAKRRASKTVAVVWRTDYDSALKEARRSGKPVFVDFYTDWCVACKYLDRTTYRDPKFVRASRSWVMVKLNSEKGARNVQITQKNRIDGFPTMVMVDGHGKNLNKVVGAYPTGMLLLEMRKAQAASDILSAANPMPRTSG